MDTELSLTILNLADMKQEKRQFDRVFKVMAVELCLSGKPTCEVAEELGIRADLLSRWKREYKQKKEGHRGAIVFQGMGSLHYPRNRPKWLD